MDDNNTTNTAFEVTAIAKRVMAENAELVKEYQENEKAIYDKLIAQVMSQMPGDFTAAEIEESLMQVLKQPFTPHPARIKDGRAEYKFKCGLEAHQEELNGEEFGKYLELVGGFKKDGIEQNSMETKINATISPEIQREWLKIILKGDKANEITLEKLKVSEVMQVLDDFFILHPTLTTVFLVTSTKNTTARR